MSQPPESPQTPEQVKAWVESLGPDEVMSLAKSIANGALFAGLSGLGGEEQNRNPEVELPDPPEQPVLLTVHVSLDETEPQVWRRLTIPGDLDLGRVHDAIQAAMGWTDSHLHRFHVSGPWSGPYFVTRTDLEEGEDGTLETDARLDQLLRAPGDTLGYIYDFGDDWAHTLLLESIETLPTPADTDESDDTATALVCLDGNGACPPEDVGGIPGYEEMAGWVRHDFDRGHAPEGWDVTQLEELRGWLPEGWHPDTFSVEEVNRDLAGLMRDDTSAVLRQLPDELQVYVSRALKPTRFELDAWLAHPDWNDSPEIDPETAAALTRPLRVVLDVVGNEIALTAAGYLPPRAVEQIFNSLDLGSEWIGKGNREDLTPPVAELRETARALGLIRKMKGRILPTALGRRLPEDPSALLAHVAKRLPLERDSFGRLATLVMLLAMAGGVPFGGDSWRGPERDLRDGLLDTVCRLMMDAGWRVHDRPLNRYDIAGATRQTRDLLDVMLRQAMAPATAPTLARLILRGTA